MYDQQQVAYNSAKESDPPTVLDSSVSQMFNYLNGQDSLINGIENKLHKILNRSQPQSVNPEKPLGVNPAPIDFTSRLSQEIEKIYANNIRLERIVKHLSEII